MRFPFSFLLSSSSLVLKILKDAHNAGKKFRVVVVDSRPKFEGKLCFFSSQYSLNKPVEANFKHLRRFSVFFESLRSSFAHFRLMTTMTTGFDVSRQKIRSHSWVLSLFIPNRAFSVQFGGISSELGRAMVRILASLVGKIPNARPNEPDMPTTRNKLKRYD